MMIFGCSGILLGRCKGVLSDFVLKKNKEIVSPLDNNKYFPFFISTGYIF